MTASQPGVPPARRQRLRRLRTPLVGLSALMLVPALFAVAHAAKVRSIGVDAEVHGELPDGVLAHIAFGPELAWLAGRDHGEVWWDRLLFSAKESVYKAWFPLTGRWLGFEEAEITIDPAGHTFQASILIDGTALAGPPLTTMSGRWLVRDGLVLTAITLPLA